MDRKITPYHNYLISNWEKTYYPILPFRFRKFWNESLGNGIFSYKVPERNSFNFNKEGLNKVMKSSSNVLSNGYEIIISESVSLGTGLHANNPWLMELPDRFPGNAGKRCCCFINGCQKVRSANGISG